MEFIFFSASLFLLFVATLHYLLFLVYRNPVVPRVARFSLFLALAAQGGFFLVRTLGGGMPLGTSLYESLIFFSWCIVLCYLLLTLKYKIPVLGAFVIPMAFILSAAAALLPNKGTGEIPPALKSYWLFIHVPLSFLGDAMFVLAFGAGVMYLLQEKQLKSKKPGVLYHRLPSLEVLDSINYRALTIGFPLLTLGIITGSIWAQYAWGAYWQWDPKETWSLITWLIYAAVLHGRLTVGWRGRKAAVFSIVGFAAVLFTFFGVNLILKGLHSYN
ncbi:MAG: c-type cytochrome biogenesis protein CcsB [Proteobacteria bacterium]|nr:c-type cytochrome biogenesis protein CcsB [Pseudomonadota bacterium]